MFDLSTSDFTKKTSDEIVILLKNKSMLEAYASLLSGTDTHNILEFGTFEGGSPIFFAEATNARRIIGIDLRKDADPINRHVQRHADRLRVFYETSQSDRAKVSKIIDENFDGPLDLVIDDASHLYEHTKAGFDIAFPHLKVGGLYVIEDWNWAHYNNPSLDENWKDQLALTNLAFELVMAVGSGSPIVSMDIQKWALIIKKGAETTSNFSLDGAIRLSERREFHRL